MGGDFLAKGRQDCSKGVYVLAGRLSIVSHSTLPGTQCRIGRLLQYRWTDIRTDGQAGTAMRPMKPVVYRPTVIADMPGIISIVTTRLFAAVVRLCSI